MALLLTFGGVGFVVPAALGDGHGRGNDQSGQEGPQGPPWGQGPDGAGPPGQLKKEQAGGGDGQDQGNNPPAAPQAAPPQAVQNVNQGEGHGNGPDGEGPPGQLKKQSFGGGNGQGHGNGNGGTGRAPVVAAPATARPGNGRGNGNGNGRGNNAAPAPVPAALPPTTASTVSAPTVTPAAAPPASAAAPPARTTRPGLGSRRRSGGGHPRSSAGRLISSGRSILPGRPAAGYTPVPSPGGAGTITLNAAGRTGPLSSDLDSTGSGSGTVPIVAGPLAPGTAQLGHAGGAASGTRSATAAASARRARRNRPLGTSIIDPAGTVIERVINVIPIGVWLALAAALALAALAGVAALRSGRRVRIQAGEVAAVTAAALTDPLTGVMNRRGFIEAAERELLRARRYDHPVALAFVDIRGLKSVNDTEGHLAGDRLLRQVTTLLRDSARTHDLVGRIGGDEMGVLLAEQSAAGAAAMIQRLRAQVPAARHALGFATPWDVTIGTAAFPEDGRTFEELLAAADRRLYEQRGIRLT